MGTETALINEDNQVYLSILDQVPAAPNCHCQLLVDGNSRPEGESGEDGLSNPEGRWTIPGAVDWRSIASGQHRLEAKLRVLPAEGDGRPQNKR